MNQEKMKAMEDMRKMLLDIKESLEETIEAQEQDSPEFVPKFIKTWMLLDAMVSGMLASIAGLTNEEIWKKEHWRRETS